MVAQVRGIACICLLTVSFAAAGDLWKQKQSSEWTAADALLLISQSPWAVQTRLKCGNPLMQCGDATLRAVPVQEPLVGAAANVPSNPFPTSGNVEAFHALASMLVARDDPHAFEPPPGTPKKELPPEPIKIDFPQPLQGAVIVLWESAVPVQTAKARLGIADTRDSRASDSYVVSVVGYPMESAIGHAIKAGQVLPAATKQFIQESAVLSRKGRPSIRASDIELAGNDSYLMVRFFFPIDPAIHASDKEVLFTMQILLGDIVEAKFTLKDMVYEGKLAISDHAAAATQR